MVSKTRFLACFALALSLLLAAAPAWAAEERILSYDVLADIQEDASVLVTETIRVVSTGNEIQRGIYRDIPTIYKDSYGNRIRVDLTVVSVLRDGNPEPYKTEAVSNGIRVRIGQENVFLTPGTYSYTISYRVTRVLGFFAQHDELYWNATGNAWGFPIDSASATVLLPPGVAQGSITTAAYTGVQGSVGQDYTVYENPDSVVFSTTRGLAPGEGLTVVVGWPKGFVPEPTSGDRVSWFFQDNFGLLLILAGLVVVLVWYLFAWMMVGRDPDKGIIIPRYTPPEGISPAAMRYIRRMGFDNKVFTAAVINLAVQGRLTIREAGDKFVLQNTGLQASSTPEEDQVHAQLFAWNDEVTLVNTNHTIIGGTIQACRTALAAAYKGKYFRANGLWLLPGIGLSALFAFLGFAASGGMSGSGFLIVWLSGWSVGVYVLLRQFITIWRTGKTGAAIFMGCFTVPFLLGWVIGFVFLIVSGGAVLSLLIALLFILNLLFAKLLKAPTYGGRRLLDEIDGFKMFLEVAEKDYLQWSATPERTPELFEKYLPYALALDVDQQWAEKFAGILAASAIDGAGYRPPWYHGSSLAGFSAGAFAGSLSNSFNSAIASSGTAPGSSSGFSGGSSGGGGGGGGGGGW